MRNQNWIDVVHEENEDERFLNEDMYDAGQYLAEMIDGVLDDAQVTITCSQDRSRLCFRVEFDDPNNNKLFVGPRFRVVNAMLELMRFQQYLKHNRYIEFELVQPNGDVQTIVNKRVFDGARSDAVEQVEAHLMKSLNVGSKQGQLRALKSVGRLIETILSEEGADHG